MCMYVCVYIYIYIYIYISYRERERKQIISMIVISSSMIPTDTSQGRPARANVLQDNATRCDTIQHLYEEFTRLARD